MGKRSRSTGHRRPLGDRSGDENLVGRVLAGDPLARRRFVDAWESGAPIAGQLASQLRAAVDRAGAGGWTDTEVRRFVARRSRGVEELLDGPTASRVEQWRRRAGLDPADVLVRIAAVVALLDGLGAAPGGRPASRSIGVDPDVLERVRALLAKAESTTFPAEAEALTAKAHELMARHAIDAALLGSRGDRGAVESRRIAVDDPYVRPKALLLHRIAAACTCQAVSIDGLGIVVVFGYAADLASVELLHTSLLVQATTAMLAAGSDVAGSRDRSRGFRSSFLLAFAGRIGERLAEVTAHAVDDARSVHGDDLLPVLASKAETVEAAMHEAIPNLSTARRQRASDGAGWSAGRAAADRADLGGRVDRVGGTRGAIAG